MHYLISHHTSMKQIVLSSVTTGELKAVQVESGTSGVQPKVCLAGEPPLIFPLPHCFPASKLSIVPIIKRYF